MTKWFRSATQDSPIKVAEHIFDAKTLRVRRKFLPFRRNRRIAWLCEELKIPYELKLYARDPVTMLAPPDYKALHPIGAPPVITDGGLVLAESGAVMEYILAKYGDAGRIESGDSLGQGAPSPGIGGIPSRSETFFGDR